MIIATSLLYLDFILIYKIQDFKKTLIGLFLLQHLSVVYLVITLTRLLPALILKYSLGSIISSFPDTSWLTEILRTFVRISPSRHRTLHPFARMRLIISNFLWCISIRKFKIKAPPSDWASETFSRLASQCIYGN